MNGKVKSADGVSIAYQVNGSGNPTLVFVHAWCCDKSYWDSQVPYFSHKHTVITLDLAGHGESGLNRDKWTVASFGEDVAAVVNHLTPEQVVLIAHCMPTPAILEASQRIPGLLGLVVVEYLTDVNRKTDQAQFDRLAVLRSSPPEVFRDRIRTLASGMFVETSDPALIEWITSDMSSTPQDVGIGAAEEFLSYDFGQALKKVDVPVWCISADNHPFNLDAARQHCPSFEAVFMSGVGHFVMLEDPETFNSLLDGIVRKLVVRLLEVLTRFTPHLIRDGSHVSSQVITPAC
ncbi:MAG: alpha/beta hydrolase [Dehalococcoidales bacterium]|nr:alpha/beta hydrolase [Dehalococcoidales bacterium]